MTYSTKRLPPDARREQLTKAAIACYAELGVERAGHGDIAKLADVSTPTVFNYFSTRDVLTNAVFDEVYKVFEAMFQSLPEPSLSTENQIENLTKSYDFLIEQHPDILKLVLNWSSSFGENVRPQYLEFQDWLLENIQTRLNKLELDESISRTVLATAYTYALMKLDETPESVLESYVERVAKGSV